MVIRSGMLVLLLCCFGANTPSARAEEVRFEGLLKRLGDKDKNVVVAAINEVRTMSVEDLEALHVLVRRSRDTRSVIFFSLAAAERDEKDLKLSSERLYDLGKPVDEGLAQNSAQLMKALHKFGMETGMLGIRMALEQTPDVREITVEALPPSVVQTVPQSGDIEVDPSLKEITVTFSKKMRTNLWDLSRWGKEDGSFPKVGDDIHFLKDKRTCVVPVELEPKTTYALWIGRGFMDEKDNTAIRYLLVFRTGKGR